jgi:ABC-type phosphate transport system auxiliary subunit
MTHDRLQEILDILFRSASLDSEHLQRVIIDRDRLQKRVVELERELADVRRALDRAREEDRRLTTTLDLMLRDG